MIRRGGVRRLLATTVAQGKFGHGVDVLHLDTDGATPRGMGPGGTQPDQIRAQAVHARCKAAFSDDRQRGIIQRNSALVKCHKVVCAERLALEFGVDV